MNNIEFVSAGAGSGKTYKLTETLAHALESGAARPHAILATTFTVKAASELRERARSWLLEKGRVDLATAIGQARLGTVNSVCGQMLKQFCFELGLSPDQTVLSEGQTKRLLETSLAETLDSAGQSVFVRLTRKFGIEQEDWAKTVKDVVKASLDNDIEPVTLRQMGGRNADQMLANWSAPTAGVDPTAALSGALATALKNVSSYVDAQVAAGTNVAKNLQDGLADLQKIERAFREGRWSWPDWLGAAGINAGAKVKHFLDPVKEAAQRHESHPAFHADVRQYLELVFNLAADARDAYSEAKKALGAVDFSDQEVLLLRAIRENASVQAVLADELDLVMVDEFQDTSPLQLALFVELAKLAKRSIWVGDPKQAIYGFRGTDASLISGVIGAIPGWGSTIGEPLTTSRRSTPALVSLTNAVFGDAFLPDLAPQDVQLQPVRKELPDQPSLLNWNFDSDKNGTDYLALGQAIAELLASKVQVEDKKTKNIRAIRPGDIGVLCRRNDQVSLAVTSLTRWGIPSASPRAGLLGTAEAIFVLACLRRMHDVSDTVASALVLTLVDATPVATWLADRLDYLEQADVIAHEWKTIGDSAHPLLVRLEGLRPSFSSLTPLEALRLSVAESHVAQLVAQWSSSPHEAHNRLANVEALVELGKNYEDECVSAKRPATVSGMLRWLDAAAEAEDDSRAATADNAVTVLTYHGSKGLEWPVVVLTALGETARSAIWSVRARTEGPFDPQLPLGNRFIHCWLKTWGKRSAPQAAVRAEASATGVAMQQDAVAESKRLLYVGLTRARDLNVLVSFVRKSGTMRGWVDEVPRASPLLFGPTEEVVLPDGQRCSRGSKDWNKDECATEPPVRTPQDRHWFTRRPHASALPLWYRPSSAVGGQFNIAETVEVGIRITLTGKPNMADLGTAVHHCIARAGVRGAVEQADVCSILSNWGVGNTVDNTAVVAQLTAFLAWCNERWPGCSTFFEVPIEANRPDGTRVRGRIDLLVQSPKGWILLDHKSNPGGADRNEQLAVEHGPQLAVYAEALIAATGISVAEQWLYLPVAGRALRLA
ncbi:ATP-dependent exoDNAse (exonuclease V) beta subunit [Herbaspirillum sp. 1173]|uniref:UvrD-helicase domain-containing protein n=1 Tax=Herbaspirillum sp. 1173 TaxID=2817734 RepID=UPI00285B1F94|nr:UvrD-helicase domain-containing protein [Herbaspirillum sp. 1173]MDR6739131.1 ATP-dependent exoDNAse (exonuclease V) beta subunit [Herbaspirillum sp. 1173]